MLWFIIAIGVLAALGLAIRASRTPDPFRTAGVSLGLDYSRSVPDLLPRLAGTRNGLAVRVDVPQQNDPTVRYRIFYPGLGMALRLERETTISRTLDTLGSGDQTTGNIGFDQSFRVNTSRPDALQKMLTPELRDRLVHLVAQYPDVVIADGEISLLAIEEPVTAEKLAGTVADLVVAAGLLVANRPPPLQPPATRPIAPPKPRSSAEARPQEPSQVQEPPRTTPQPVPVSAPEPDPVPDPVDSTGLPDGFFEDVFGESRLSFESDDRFEREIKGRTVHLSGTAKQASHYENRSELSPPDGTKAIVTVARIDSDLYGKTDIDAVVYLAGKEDLNRGDTVSFTGTIDAVDAFMRNLVVSDASLTHG